jgi:hypothetical protein
LENKELMSAITLYRSQYEAIIKLPDPDFRIITGAILKYAFDDETPEDLTTLQLAVFDMCKGNIDKSNERRRMKAERNKKYYENQKKFSHIKTRSDTLRQVQTGSSHNENENENENENVNVNENVNENENENENNIYNNSLSERENFLKKICKWHDEWNDPEGVVDPEGYVLYVEGNDCPKTKKYFESYCFNVKKLRKKKKVEEKAEEEVVPDVEAPRMSKEEWEKWMQEGDEENV